MKTKNASRLAADWEPSAEELARMHQAEEASYTEEPDNEEEAAVEIIDPRWLRGGASFQRFSPFATDDEEEEARQAAREQRAWDPEASWVKEMLQPAEIGAIPRGKGSRSGRRRRSESVQGTKQTERNDDDPAKEAQVMLYRFRARLSPGEYYFYEIRPGYKNVVLLRYLEEIRINGFERRDMRKRYVTEGVLRNRKLSIYVQRIELEELAICPSGAMQALAHRARVEDTHRVEAVDQLAKKKRKA